MVEEKIISKASNGMPVLLLNILFIIGAVALLFWGITKVVDGDSVSLGVFLIVTGSLYAFIIGPVIFFGLKIIRPNEALVLTLFGKYYGSLRGEGFYFVNPFVSAINPVSEAKASAGAKDNKSDIDTYFPNKRISLKAITLNNERQKINDLHGNPIIIGVVVIWRVVNTAKAVFSVDNFKDYLSLQCDSALRNIVRSYPYDTPDDDSELSLRGSSQVIAEKLKKEIQEKSEIAGLEIIEARITHLAYASEIAAAMLQRQQASAIVDARQKIVEGAVGMVEMALEMLNEKEIVQLDEERKAAMVSNLLVVLCGNQDTQPVVNAGTLY